MKQTIAKTICRSDAATARVYDAVRGLYFPTLYAAGSMLHACSVVFYIDGPQPIVEKKLRVILSEAGDSWLHASDGEGWEVKSVTKLPSLEEYNRVIEGRGDAQV